VASHLNNNALGNLCFTLIRKIFAYKHEHKVKVSDAMLFKFGTTYARKLLVYHYKGKYR